MDGQIGVGNRFTELHSRFMPRIYRIATWLLGDADDAEKAAGRAFIRALECAGTPDAREFGVSCARLLLEECGRTGMTRHDPGGADAGELEKLMSRLCGFDRCIVALTVCGGFSVPETALIAHCPELRVEMCIKSAAKRMRAESRDYSAVTAS